ncbi:hypothetical protein X975_01767, partial [Stegodyphus mimosarum]
MKHYHFLNVLCFVLTFISESALEKEIVDIINDRNEVIIYQERDPNTRSLKQYLVENEMISDCGKECRDPLNIVKRTTKTLMAKGQ